MLYEIATDGETPLKELKNVEVMSKVQSGYHPARPDTCVPNFYAVMCNCWDLDPAARPSFNDLVTTFMSGVCDSEQRTHGTTTDHTIKSKTKQTKANNGEGYYTAEAADAASTSKKAASKANNGEGYYTAEAANASPTAKKKTLKANNGGGYLNVGASVKAKKTTLRDNKVDAGYTGYIAPAQKKNTARLTSEGFAPCGSADNTTVSATGVESITDSGYVVKGSAGDANNVRLYSVPFASGGTATLTANAEIAISVVPNAYTDGKSKVSTEIETFFGFEGC